MIRRIAVIVPAANEEALIDGCLAAVSATAAEASVPVQIIVVLDACTDGTGRAVRRWTGVSTVTTSARNVGVARGVGATHALLGADPRELWLANTDADSEVPVDWLTGMIRLSASADLVLGTVVPDAGLHPATERRWLAEHVQNDGHPHVHGANLGIRADAYLALGGWQPLAVHEDEDLATRAVDAGLRVCRTASLPVRTSTRVIGRAPSGFSSYLRDLGHV